MEGLGEIDEEEEMKSDEEDNKNLGSNLFANF